jgi:hypothetical protein
VAGRSVRLAGDGPGGIFVMDDNTFGLKGQWERIAEKLVISPGAETTVPLTNAPALPGVQFRFADPELASPFGPWRSFSLLACRVSLAEGASSWPPYWAPV